MTTQHSKTTLVVSGYLWSGAKVRGVAYRVNPEKIPANLAAAKAVAGDFESVTSAYIEKETVTVESKRNRLKN